MMDDQSEYISRHCITDMIREIIKYVGDDPDREGLRDTPARMKRAWQEMLGGYGLKPLDALNTRFAAEGMDEMILVRGIEFTSFCEHHWLPFSGHVDFGYLPDKYVIGLSKIPRLVDVYAKRLQVQERMTSQIAVEFAQHMACKGVGVVVTAVHSCMSCRGVKKQDASMVTSKLLGAFKDDPSTRSEFLSFVNGDNKS